LWNLKASDDEDAVVMFLENKRSSGGGDIERYELNAKKKLLSVKYQSYLHKKRVLTRRYLKFQEYSITANEPLSLVNFPKDLKTLILRRFRDGEDTSNVMLYAENLLDDDENDIQWIKSSGYIFLINLFILFIIVN